MSVQTCSMTERFAEEQNKVIKKYPRMSADERIRTANKTFLYRPIIVYDIKYLLTLLQDYPNFNDEIIHNVCTITKPIIWARHLFQRMTFIEWNFDISEQLFDEYYLKLFRIIYAGTHKLFVWYKNDDESIIKLLSGYTPSNKDPIVSKINTYDTPKLNQLALEVLSEFDAVHEKMFECYSKVNLIKISDESLKNYNEFEEKKRKELQKEFKKSSLKEELMAKVWHPRNFEKFKYLDPETFGEEF